MPPPGVGNSAGETVITFAACNSTNGDVQSVTCPLTWRTILLTPHTGTVEWNMVQEHTHTEVQRTR